MTFRQRMHPEGLEMALLRRKRLIRFGTEKPTFIELPEGEILTPTRH